MSVSARVSSASAMTPSPAIRHGFRNSPKCAEGRAAAPVVRAAQYAFDALHAAIAPDTHRLVQF
jgi:hypothetical protein